MTWSKSAGAHRRARGRSTSAGLALSLSVSVGGCHRDQSLDDVAEVVARSERVLVYSDRAEVPVTAGDLAVLDRHIACVEAIFGTSDARYRVLLNEDIEDWKCPPGIPGCYGDKARVAVVDFSDADAAIPDVGDTIRHELVHAVAHRARLRAPTFFEEGRASQLAYVCGPSLPDYVLPASPDYAPDFDALLAEPAGDAYFAARKVAAALWRDEAGRDLLEDLSRELSTDEDPARVRKRYATLTGETLEETWSKIQQVDIAIEGSPELPARPATLAPGEERLEISEDGPQVLSIMADGYREDWRQVQSAIRIEAAGTYELQVAVDAPRTPRLFIAPLDCPADTTAGTALADASAEILELGACTYALDFFGPIGSQATVVVTPQQ